MPIQNWRELQDALVEKQTGQIPVDDTMIDGLDFSEPLSYGDKLRVLDAYIGSMSNKEGFMSGVRDTQQDIINNPQDYSQEAAELGYGSARIDKKIPYDIWRLNPDEARAVTQTQAGKLVNGALKMIPYANTTFLDNTVGLIAGIANVAGDALDGGEFHPGQSFINTSFAQQLQDIRDIADRILPNYRTQEELDDSDRWWRHLNGNFWGDTFLKNLGFTIGAGASALVGSAGAFALQGKAIRQAYKAALSAKGGEKAAVEAFQRVLQGGKAMNTKQLYDTFESARKAYRRLNWEGQLVGGIGGAIGESRVEAMNAAKEYRDSQAQSIEDIYERGKAQLLDDVAANYTVYEDVYDGFGNKIGTRPTISKDGWDYYNSQLANLQNDYSSAMDIVENEADNVANHTFWFNMPLLTGSNIVMFGRMMSGGFKTQAKNMLKGKPGVYKGAGSVAEEWAKNVGRAATEGIEELSQKVFSEGAKDVSNANIGAFHNGKYDTDAIKGTAQWLSSLMDSASDVLSDPESWEEFAIGMLTGTIAQVPGGGWRAGIDQVKSNRVAADELNKRMSDPEFKALWEGLVRHRHYEDQKDAALNHTIKDKDGDVVKVGDQFVWHGLNDAEILSDVKMFADSGRLSDLEDYVDSFANITIDDVQKISSQLIDETDSDFQNKSDAQKLDWLHDRAYEVKKAINQYRNFHDSIDTMSMGTSDKEIIDEMVFTQAQLQNFEDRYNRLLKQVSDRIVPTLESIAQETDKDGAPTQRAVEARLRLTYRELLSRLFGGIALDVHNQVKEFRSGDETYTPVEVDDEVQKDALNKLESWGAFTNDPTLKQDVIDLQKLVRSRQKYYSNLFDPRFRQKFEKNAKTAGDAAKQIQTEKADRETANLKTLADVKNAYLSKDADGRKAFVRDIRTSSMPNKKEFSDLLLASEQLKDELGNSHPNLINKSTGGFSRVAEIVLDDMFSRANNADDYVNKIGTEPISIGEINNRLSQLVKGGVISEDEALPIMVNQQYSAIVDAINDVAPTFKSDWKNSYGKENISKPVDNNTKPVDDNANPESATKPNPKESVKAQPANPVKREDAVQPENATVSEVEEAQVDTGDSGELRVETNATIEDDTVPEDKSYRRDGKGMSKLGYYQMSIGELKLTEAAQIRDLLVRRKTADKDEIEFIDKEIASIGIPDLVQFDKDGNPIGGEIGYADTYKWLRDEGAFSYVATKLGVNQEVVFAIVDGAPKYEGKPQIVVATIKSRDAEGNITAVQPLSILHSMGKSDKYMYLDELYDAIRSDYDSTTPSGSLYVFGGLKNPYTSKVFDIRPGLVRYNEISKSVDKIDDYDPNAPIIILDANNQPILLRGNADVSKMSMPNIYPWSKSHAGRIYYMVKNGTNGGYTPILLDKAIVTSEELENAPNDGFLANVNKIVSAIDNLTANLNPENLEQSNANLRGQIGKLNKYVNIYGVSFTFENEVDPNLHISWKTTRNVQGETFVDDNDINVMPGESILSVFDKLNRQIRMSFKPENIADIKRNLQQIINDGLITSNADKLRQVGVNFTFDPWNGKDKFERILPSNKQDVKTMPKAGPQVVSVDAEMGEPASEPVDTSNVDKEPQKEVAPTTIHVSDDIDDLLSEVQQANPVDEISKDYVDLSQESKATLVRKNTSEDMWNKIKNPNVRKILLKC